MKRILVVFLLILFCGRDVMSSQTPSQADAEVALFLKYLLALQRQLGIPGVSAAVLKNERIVWEGGFGFQDVERRIPATANTPYPIASLTKTFASVILLQCVERGTLDLNTPINRYTNIIPESAATIRHVLSHTSQAAPGQRFQYDGNRYAALTPVVEACANAPLRQILAREVLDRAAMQDSAPGHDLESPDLATATLFDPTTLARYQQVLARIAKPYVVDSRGRAKPSVFPPKGINAAAGLVSTVHDLALYDLALSSHLFLHAETQELAWTPGVTNAGEPIPYGLGWFVQDIDGERVIWHYGLWENSFSSLIVKVPARGLTLIILANSDGLSAKFPLSEGDTLVSPFASAFLRIVR
jgi:CubicO group peptidase (beta-lactamase class C family)